MNKHEQLYMDYKHSELKIGDRVCVFYSVTPNKIKIYGFGVYLGLKESHNPTVLTQHEFFCEKYKLDFSKEGCVNLDNSGGLVWSREGVFIPEEYANQILSLCDNIIYINSKQNYMTEI